MIELKQGALMALVLLGKDESGKSTGAVFFGRLRLMDGDHLLWRGKKPPFTIREEWLERIKVAPPDTDFLDDAELVLTLSCGNIDEVEGPLVDTGLQWPGAMD